MNLGRGVLVLEFGLGGLVLESWSWGSLGLGLSLVWICVQVAQQNLSRNSVAMYLNLFNRKNVRVGRRTLRQSRKVILCFSWFFLQAPCQLEGDTEGVCTGIPNGESEQQKLIEYKLMFCVT